MKQKKPDAKSRLIAIIIAGVFFFILLFFGYGTESHRIGALVISPIIIIIGAVGWLRETRDDRKAAETQSSMTDGSYFGSAEWRQKYLEYVESHGWETVSPKGMKADMCSRYNNGSSRAMLLMGAFFVIVGIAAMTAAESSRDAVLFTLMIALGVFLLYVGISGCFGLPVRWWLRNTSYDKEALERSYCGGKLLSYKTSDSISGLNIGHDFIIFFTEKRVYAIPADRAESAGRNIVRVKKYGNEFYTGQEMRHFLSLTARTDSGTLQKIEVRLNEFQVEMAMEELKSRGIKED